MNNFNEIICKTIDDALFKHCQHCSRDITYLCEVIDVYENQRYKLKYKNMDYYIQTKNTTLSLYDKVHLVAPCGNFNEKFLLEDLQAVIHDNDEPIEIERISDVTIERILNL